jgi:hypothetical protein
MRNSCFYIFTIFYHLLVNYLIFTILPVNLKAGKSSTLVFINKTFLMIFAIISGIYIVRDFKICKVGLQVIEIDETGPVQRAAGTYLAPGI